MISEFFEEADRKGGVATALKQRALRWIFDSINGSGSWDRMTKRESDFKQELWELERILRFCRAHDMSDPQEHQQMVTEAIKRSSVSNNPVTGKPWTSEQVAVALDRLDENERQRITPRYSAEAISERRFHDAEEQSHAEYMAVLCDPSATARDKELALDRYTRVLPVQERLAIARWQVAVEEPHDPY